MAKKRGVDFARNQLVIKSNDLIQKTRFNLDELEQKILDYLISKIPHDIMHEESELQPFVFRIKDFAAVCGINDGGKAYSVIRDAVQTLADKSIWIKLNSGNEFLLRTIHYVMMNKVESTIKIELDPLIVPYLVHLRERFTQFQLRNILSLRGKYSIRVYELLRSYANLDEPITFDIDRIKVNFSATDYERFPDFRRRVLEPAIAEINKMTDIEVSYSTITEGRKVTHVVFNVRLKASFETLDAVNRQERRFNNQPESEPSGQISLDDDIF